MHPRFRFALVGAGLITQQSHLPAALASPFAEVAAIVDPVVDRAAELVKAFGIAPRIVPSVDEVLSEIDGAIIATPNDSHRSIALTCLRAGIPTLIEKPLASSYEEGLAIVRACDEADSIVAVGYSTRFRDNVHLLKRLLDENYFGTVRRFAHQFGTAGGWAPLSAYNLSRTATGGGVLVVTGTHFLDRMLYFWGFPSEFSLIDDAMGGPEANCTASFVYNSSTAFTGVARYSKTVRLPAGMVIETEEGFIVLRDSDDAAIVFRPHSRETIEYVVHQRGPPPWNPSASVFQRQLEDFIAACRDHRPPLVDGRQGLESLRLLEALYARREPCNVDFYEHAVARRAQ